MFAIRRSFARIQASLCKTYATNSKLVEVTQDGSTGITTISMANPPVNILSKQLLSALNSSLMDTQRDNSRGVILTSSLPTVFSAGLDIMEMYNRTEKQLTEYWQILQDTWLTLYGLEIPIAAAINGSSPAGGCALALSCEYRVLTDGKNTIGLNETRLGLQPPTWFNFMLIDTIGYRKAELALLRGSLFSPKEALAIGLVDELAADKADAVKKCQGYINGFKNVAFLGRSATKLNLRKHNLHWLKENRQWDVASFVEFVQLPKVQVGLKLYIESLKQK